MPHNHRKRNKWSGAKKQREYLIKWFETRVMDEEVSEWWKVSSRGPNDVPRSYAWHVISHICLSRYSAP